MQRALIYDTILGSGPRGTRFVPSRFVVRGPGSGDVACLRGSVVIDKSFVIMALACAAAPLVGAGVYIVVYLF